MITATVTNPSVELISNHQFAGVLLNKDTNQKSLHAAQAFMPGDVICKFEAAQVLDHPTYLTVQTGMATHITLMPEFLQYINHSCNPSVFFNTTSMELVCLQQLQPGDELTFFYPGTEWEMAQPFVCNCGYSGCLQLINGASHLSAETLSLYKLTDFIRQQVTLKYGL
jgi:hypothetical protein